ncbi:MAG: ABC transporter ATP-binding protein [Fimbriimonadaceae bacterium]|nr:ABC transporter ATP-binding protein [Fimbriimonadaceae bacterium]
MLQFASLVKKYKNHLAVDGLSFTVNPGEIVGLLGPNGAGKTTAIRCAVGILRPTDGAIYVCGYNVEDSPSEAKSRLAFVPELPALYELLTVNEHLRFIAMCFRRLDLFERDGDLLLSRYDLLEKKDKLVATLSKGMRQKLAVACAFVHDAKVLVLDEPIIGVDPAGIAEMKKALFEARDSGCAVLVSTHQLDTAERLCNRVVILAKGKKVAEGTLDEIRAARGQGDATLEELFLQLTQEARDATPPVPL